MNQPGTGWIVVLADGKPVGLDAADTRRTKTNVVDSETTSTAKVRIWRVLAADFTKDRIFSQRAYPVKYYRTTRIDRLEGAFVDDSTVNAASGL